VSNGVLMEIVYANGLVRQLFQKTTLRQQETTSVADGGQKKLTLFIHFEESK